MADLATVLMGAAGAAGGDNLYIEDVFSTYLYTGNNTSQTITNGIDLDSEGGMVWIKARNGTNAPVLTDTVKGAFSQLRSNLTDAQLTEINMITAFTASGFSLGASSFVNQGSPAPVLDYVSWTFRKAPKFFDVVTYTGTGANRTVSHDLGSVPGCIMVKRTDTTGDWQVYHRANTANPETDFLILNTTAATADSNTRWNDTQPTDAVFSLGTEATVNASGGTYVAYLWAHDAGGFGDDGLQNVVTCGSYVGTGAAGNPVTLGYEPQWVLIKRATGDVGNWNLFDTARGYPNASVAGSELLVANSSAAAQAGNNTGITATGFEFGSGAFNNSGATFIYIAIRRGPMKTPTAGTEVYNGITRTGTGATANVTGVGFPPDLLISGGRNGTYGHSFTDRLRGAAVNLLSYATGSENSEPTAVTGFTMGGVTLGSDSQGLVNQSGINYINNFFRRAPGFFDEVCYTGTGSATTFAHNLGVVPELMIVKKRSASDDWAGYAGDNTDFLLLNTTAATADDNTYWNDTSPTSSVFSVGTNADVNTSAATYVAYLFASLAGVSDIGTYTGNGSSVTVTTGFQPRFILVKRTSSTGNWIYGDSARGLVAGDDPFLLLNSTAAETTNQDWVDVSATGFTVNETAANANVSAATYLYLAIS